MFVSKKQCKHVLTYKTQILYCIFVLEQRDEMLKKQKQGKEKLKLFREEVRFIPAYK